MSFGSFNQNFTEMSYDQLIAIAKGQLLINKKTVSKRDRLKCTDILRQRIQFQLDKHKDVFIEVKNTGKSVDSLSQEILMLENKKTVLKQLAIEVTHSPN